MNIPISSVPYENIRINDRVRLELNNGEWQYGTVIEKLLKARRPITEPDHLENAIVFSFSEFIFTTYRYHASATDIYYLEKT